jgi:hypothetical protein
VEEVNSIDRRAQFDDKAVCMLTGVELLPRDRLNFQLSMQHRNDLLIRRCGEEPAFARGRIAIHKPPFLLSHTMKRHHQSRGEPPKRGLHDAELLSILVSIS